MKLLKRCGVFWMRFLTVLALFAGIFFSAPSHALQIGDRVQANGTVNVRSTPAGISLGTQASGNQGSIVAGSQTASLSGTSYTWWSVNWDAGVDGWVADVGLTFVAPAPTINSVSPNPVTGSNSAQTINIYGTNFVNKPTVAVTWTGGGSTLSAAQVTYVSSTQLQMSITTQTAADNWTVKVTNPDGKVSNTVGFTVNAPVVVAPAPTISSVSPNPVTGSNSTQTITINGTNFVNEPTVAVTWTGGGSTLSAAQVTYLSSTQLQMSITTQTAADNWTVKVTNPDGQSSNTVGFTVAAPAAPAPTISSVSPNTVTGVALPGRVNITLYGSNFVSGLSVSLTWAAAGGGSATLSSANTTFVSSTQVNISVATDVTPDNWTVKVTNPDGRGSNTANFTVSAPVSTTGNLNVTVKNADGTLASGTQVKRYDTAWTLIDTVQTVGGIATWPSINTGTYHFEVYNPVAGSATPEYWATTLNVAVTAGVTTNITMQRDAPYANNFVVFNGTANVTGGTVAINTPLRYEVVVRNAKTYAQTVRVRFRADQDQVAPFDLPETLSASQTIPANGTATFSFNHTPSVAGNYYRSFEVETDVNSNGIFTKTDSWAWGLAVTVTSATVPVSTPMAPGLTIITHGHQPLGGPLPTWVTAMATAIAGPNTPIYTIQAQRNFIQTTQPTTSFFPLQGIITPTTSSLVVVVDWASLAGSDSTGFSLTGIFPTGLIGDAVYQAFVNHPELEKFLQLPIHFIGHSRGTSVNSRVVGLLAKNGIWVDHVTTLDPHPINWFGLGDEPVMSWSNIIFADNYYRSINFTSLNPAGNPIPGTSEVDLNGVVTNDSGNLAHTKVHTYYHHTIDASQPSPDGVPIEPTWFASPWPAASQTGFAFSRIIANGLANRPPSGLHVDIGGVGTRQLIQAVPANLPWPNVYLKPLAKYDYQVGDTVFIPYHYQDEDNGMDIVLSLDDDENPFNTVGSSCQKPAKTILGLSSSITIMPGIYSWTTTSADIGTCYLQAKATDPSGHVRYDYLSKPITINASAAVGLNPPVIASPGTSTDTSLTTSSLTPTFTWNPVAGASEYGFYISKQPYGPANLVYTSTSLTGTSFTIPSGYLVSGTKYRWQMTSIANGVESATNSALLYFQTPTITTFAITTGASPAAGGVTGGVAIYTSGANVTVVAAPNAGYSFMNWTENGAVVSSAASYTFTASANRNLVANFAVVVTTTYTLNVSAANGVVVKSPDQANYSSGSQVTLTATPASGYTFSGWSGGATGTVNPLVVSMISNLNITANFTAVASQVGSIRLDIIPAAAVTAGAQWRIVGEPAWRSSGATASGLPLGTYNIEFSSVAGWTTPANQVVPISLVIPDTWVNSGSYVQPQLVTINAPSNLQATADSNGGVALSWSDNSTNEIGFKLEQKFGTATTFSHKANLNPNTTSSTDTNVALGMAWCYRMAAIDLYGALSGYSNEACAVPQITDATPPAISTTTPVAGATNVSINTPTITVVFSEPMNPATVTGNFLNISGGVSIGAPSTVDNITFNFPIGALSGNTTYTITFNTGPTDVAGNAVSLSAPKSFTTAPASAPATHMTTGNNFTMLNALGSLVGGTNDVTFTWDGTYKTSVAASGQIPNATLLSPTAFYGFPWVAHDVAIYGPGTYTVYTGCPSGSPGCGVGAPYTFTVGADQIGMHMLFDWNANTNIDIVNVWDKNSLFGPSIMYVGSLNPNGNTPATVWDGMSSDADGNGVNGIAMVEGPFIGFNINFNVMGLQLINKVSPTSFATGVATNSPVKVTFSAVMAASSVTGDTFTLKRTLDNAPISGTVSGAGATYIFTPISSLAVNTQYTATITTGVTDIAGNALPSSYSWNFTTSIWGSTLTGHVLDSSGAGVGGVSVNAYSGGSGGVGYAATDPDGSYSIPLPVGTYTVNINKFSVPCMPTAAITCPPPSPSYYASVSNVNVTGSTIKDFSLPAIVTLSGKVSDSNGVGVTNVSLAANVPLGPPFLDSATTGLDGTYSLTVYAGIYDIRIASGGTGYIAAPGISITADAVRNFTLLTSQAVLTGHVLNSNGTGVGGANVFASDLTVGGPHTSGMGTTAPDGSYSIPLLFGTYTVSVNVFCVPAPSNLNCSTPGPMYSSSVSNVGISGATVQNFSLPPIVTLSGKVTDASGLGMANVILSANGANGPGNFATTGIDGTYSVPLYQGVYDIALSSYFGGAGSSIVSTGLSITADSIKNFTFSVPRVAVSAGMLVFIQQQSLTELPSLANMPPGFSFGNGFVSFSIMNITPGSSANVVLTLPTLAPGDIAYWVDGTGFHQIPGAVFDYAAKTVTFTVTDGGFGDTDGLANGIIVDPVGVGTPLLQDLMSPNLNVTSPLNGSVVTSTPIAIAGTASDAGQGNSGIGYVTVNSVAATGGTATGSGSANWSALVNLYPGPNAITVAAADGSSNANYASWNHTVIYNPPLINSSNDGLPDVWKTAHGISLTGNSAAGDPDGDGYANRLEYATGTDPNNVLSKPEGVNGLSYVQFRDRFDDGQYNDRWSLGSIAPFTQYALTESGTSLNSIIQQPTTGCTGFQLLSFATMDATNTVYQAKLRMDGYGKTSVGLMNGSDPSNLIELIFDNDNTPTLQIRSVDAGVVTLVMAAYPAVYRGTDVSVRLIKSSTNYAAVFVNHVLQGLLNNNGLGNVGLRPFMTMESCLNNGGSLNSSFSLVELPLDRDGDGLPDLYEDKSLNGIVDAGESDPLNPDTDHDGVQEGFDNCTLAANANQRDTNSDGYGNVCDPDLNNDGLVDNTDLGIMKLRFYGRDPDADLNGDGVVNFGDLAILKAYLGKKPGPSGLAW